MMFESNDSAFDQALSKPFLAERKKKWSLLSASNSACTVATVTFFPSYYNQSHGADEAISDFSTSYEAPSLDEEDDETIVFHENDEGLRRSLTLKAADLEAAIVRERHGAITEVHQSMSQILDIQNGKQLDNNKLIRRYCTPVLAHALLLFDACFALADLSALIKAQDEDIDNLLSFSIEAEQHAQEGVKQLQRASRYYSVKQQQRFMVVYVLVMVFGAYWIFGTSNKAA